jgi:hypothetical protein
MKPKEKAQELINKFYFDTSLTDIEEVKECALIAVDEIIDSHNNDNKWYWLDVKKKIEKL